MKDVTQNVEGDGNVAVLEQPQTTEEETNAAEATAPSEASEPQPAEGNGATSAPESALPTGEMAAADASAAPETEAEPAEEPVGSRGPAINGDWDHEMQQRIRKARKKEREAEANVEALKEEMKAAKEELDEASAYLGKLIDESETPTLFNTNTTSRKPEKPTKEDAPQAEPTPIQTDGSDDAWRSIPVSELGLKPRTLKAIADNFESVDVVTLGALTDWKNAREHRRWTDIKGVGDKAADAIDEGYEKVFERIRKGEQQKHDVTTTPAGSAPEAKLDVEAEAAARDSLERLGRKIKERCNALEIDVSHPLLQVSVLVGLIGALYPDIAADVEAIDVEVNGAASGDIDAWVESIGKFDDEQFKSVATKAITEPVVTVATALEAADDIRSTIAELEAGKYERGQQFFDDVDKSVQDVHETIHGAGKVTSKQILALIGWQRGVEAWHG